MPSALSGGQSGSTVERNGTPRLDIIRQDLRPVAPPSRVVLNSTDVIEAATDTFAIVPGTTGDVTDSGTDTLTLVESSAQGVRTGSDHAFNPSSISGLQEWLKADAIVGLADGAAVSTWPDSSGAGRDLTGTGTTRPLYKTNVVNGLPVVRFDGLDDFLLGSAAFALKHVFAVVKYSAAAMQGGGFKGLVTDAGGATLEAGIALIGGSGGSTIFYNQAGTTIYFKNGVPFAEGSMQAPMNVFGVVDISLAAGWSWAALQVGKDRAQAGRFWLGDVAEILVYDTVLSSNDRQAVESYLGYKYGLTFDPATFTDSGVGSIASTGSDARVLSESAARAVSSTGSTTNVLSNPTGGVQASNTDLIAVTFSGSASLARAALDTRAISESATTSLARGAADSWAVVTSTGLALAGGAADTFVISSTGSVPLPPVVERTQAHPVSITTHGDGSTSHDSARAATATDSSEKIGSRDYEKDPPS